MNTENELFGELHEQEENGLFGNEHRRQYEEQQEALSIHDVSSSLPSKRNCFECNEELNKEELFCSYCRRQ